MAFVANRAHHAEIGGRTPGSMPALASCLAEEGVVLAPTLLFEGGANRFSVVEELFRSAAYPSRMLAAPLAEAGVGTHAGRGAGARRASGS